MGRNYLNQFGPEFAVPDSIVRLLDAGHLTDTSWGNDTCPSFEAEYGTTHIRLYVEPADPELREFDPDASRFYINHERDDADPYMDAVTVFSTDDEQELLAALKCFMASGTIPTRR